MCTPRRYYPENFRIVEDPVQVLGASAVGEGGSGEADAAPRRRLMVVESTARVRDGLFFLRPDPAVTRIILGIIGRAQEALGVVIYGIHVLSNHLCILAGVESVEQNGRFLNWILGEIAKRIGDLWGKVERIWSRRVRVIPVDAEAAWLEARLRYCLANGVKEHLVTHATDWLGVHSAWHLCLGRSMEGVWTDGTAWGRAKRRRKHKPAPEAEFQRTYAVVHSKLPSLAHLSDADYCALVRRWCDEDAEAARQARIESRRLAAALQKPELGIPEPGHPSRFLQVAVTDRPETFEPTPAPPIHASQARRQQYRALVKAYCAALAANRARLLAQCRGEGSDFPREGLPPTGMPPVEGSLGARPPGIVPPVWVASPS